MPRIGNKNALRHGGVGTSTHNVWMGMKARCDNPNNKDYKNYGGRGITYAPAWSDFAAFRADMGERPEGMSLERIDNGKGYSPDNCRWATLEKQNNNRRTTRLFTYKGQTLSMVQWSRLKGWPDNTVKERIRQGWSIDRALTTPVRSSRRA